MLHCSTQSKLWFFALNFKRAIRKWVLHWILDYSKIEENEYFCECGQNLLKRIWDRFIVGVHNEQLKIEVRRGEIDALETDDFIISAGRVFKLAL